MTQDLPATRGSELRAGFKDLAVTHSFDVYRREAQRLYELAGSLPLGRVRNELLEIARQYEALARHAEVMERRTTTELSDHIPSLASIRLVPER